MMKYKYIKLGPATTSRVCDSFVQISPNMFSLLECFQINFHFSEDEYDHLDDRRETIGGMLYS